MQKNNVKKTVYLNPKTIDDVETYFRSDNCSTQSEFIEKAIRYYVGYLMSERNTDYLSPTIMSSMKAASNENTTRITRMLFKQAVEVAMMNNLVAAMINFDSEQYGVLRRECEYMVRRTNGDFGMEDAHRWQHQDE